MVSDQVVDSLTLEVEKLWWSNRGRFQRADGFGGTETDEKALKKFIAKQLGVRPEAVHLAILRPWRKAVREKQIMRKGEAGAAGVRALAPVNVPKSSSPATQS